MAHLFGHEKLKVYQKALDFARQRRSLLDSLSRRVAACDHLDRAAESILLNIAHASSSWSPKKRVAHLGDANGSALECAACLDVFVAKGMLTHKDVYAQKRLLAEVVNMLIRMWKKTEDRVGEEEVVYSTNPKILFSHETLDVYQAGLQLISWLESTLHQFSCSAKVLTKLDRSTTSIVLNTAEGNGRFSGADQTNFIGIAYKSTVQSASLLDLATADSSTGVDCTKKGCELLRRIAAMLTSLSRSAGEDT